MQIASRVHDVDLILVEGCKREALTQIGVCRQAAGMGYPADISRYVAVMTDADIGTRSSDIPHFGFDEFEELAEFVIKNMDYFTRINELGRMKAVDAEENPSNGLADRAQEPHRHLRRSPSMDEWMKEAKADPSAAKGGKPPKQMSAAAARRQFLFAECCFPMMREEQLWQLRIHTR